MFTWYTNTSYSLFQKKSLVSQKVPLFPKFDPAVLLLLSIQKNPFFPCPAKTFACDLLPEQKCFFLGCILFDPNGQYIYLVVMCFGTQNSGFLTRIGTKICMEFFWSKLGKSYYRILVIFARGLNFLPQFKIRVKIKGRLILRLILRFILFSIYVRVKL